MSAPAATNQGWTVQTVLRWATDDFTKRDFDAPRLDAELLLSHVLKLDRVRLILDAARPLDAAELTRFRALIQRRRNHEPIAYILGEREFFGLRFRTGAGVLVPRPDSECLVEIALKRTRPRDLFGRALDLCTGSGCIGIAFARQRPTWRMTLTDSSQSALTCAAHNTVSLGAAFQVTILDGDLFEAVGPSRFELITANPPYIASADIGGLQPDVRDHEPRVALDGGPDGLSIIRRIVEEAPSHLVAGGVLALEIGFDQGEAVRALFSERGFDDIWLDQDYAGRDRVVSGVLPTG